MHSTPQIPSADAFTILVYGQQVYGADEAFVTGTFGGVIPVVEVTVQQSHHIYIGGGVCTLAVTGKQMKYHIVKPAAPESTVGNFRQSTPGLVILTLTVVHMVGPGRCAGGRTQDWRRSTWTFV
eukprot:7271644-Pyramimonas_sp.AAC.1